MSLSRSASSSPLPPSPPPPAPAVSFAGPALSSPFAPLVVPSDLSFLSSVVSPGLSFLSSSNRPASSSTSGGAASLSSVVSPDSSFLSSSLVSSGADSAVASSLPPVISATPSLPVVAPSLVAAAAVSAATSALYSPNKTRSFPASLSFAILPSRTFNALLSLLSCASVASCVSLDLLLSSCKSLYLFFAALNAFLRSLNPNLAPKNVPARTASPAKLVAATPVIAPAASAPTRPTSPPVNTVPTAKTPIIPNTGPTIFLL